MQRKGLRSVLQGANFEHMNFLVAEWEEPWDKGGQDWTNSLYYSSLEQWQAGAHRERGVRSMCRTVFLTAGTEDALGSVHRPVWVPVEGEQCQARRLYFREGMSCMVRWQYLHKSMCWCLQGLGLPDHSVFYNGRPQIWSKGLGRARYEKQLWFHKPPKLSFLGSDPSGNLWLSSLPRSL